MAKYSFLQKLYLVILSGYTSLVLRLTKDFILDKLKTLFVLDLILPNQYYHCTAVSGNRGNFLNGILASTQDLEAIATVNLCCTSVLHIF